MDFGVSGVNTCNWLKRSGEAFKCLCHCRLAATLRDGLALGGLAAQQKRLRQGAFATDLE